MNKLKLSKGLAAAILLGCMFAGWQSMLLVSVLMLIFCEVEGMKKVMTRILTFYIGISLFAMFWDLIVDGYGAIYSSIQGLENVINSYASKPIDISKLYQYLLTPLKTIIGVCDVIVKYLIVLAKFGFIIAVLTNKKEHSNVIGNFINKYVDKAVTFINNIDVEAKEEK